MKPWATGHITELVETKLQTESKKMSFSAPKNELQFTLYQGERKPLHFPWLHFVLYVPVSLQTSVTWAEHDTRAWGDFSGPLAGSEPRSSIQGGAVSCWEHRAGGAASAWGTATAEPGFMRAAQGVPHTWGQPDNSSQGWLNICRL